jgi:hypothetical protein
MSVEARESLRRSFDDENFLSNRPGVVWGLRQCCGEIALLESEPKFLRMVRIWCMFKSRGSMSAFAALLPAKTKVK